MKITKTFDCVALKDSIQAKLLEKRAGMSDRDARAEVERTLRESQSPVARLWRQLISARP